MLTCFVACDINNKETRREGKCLCVLLLIYQQRENGRDPLVSKRKKKMEVQETESGRIEET